MSLLDISKILPGTPSTQFSIATCLCVSAFAWLGTEIQAEYTGKVKRSLSNVPVFMLTVVSTWLLSYIMVNILVASASTSSAGLVFLVSLLAAVTSIYMMSRIDDNVRVFCISSLVCSVIVYLALYMTGAPSWYILLYSGIGSGSVLCYQYMNYDNRKTNDTVTQTWHETPEGSARGNVSSKPASTKPHDTQAEIPATSPLAQAIKNPDQDGSKQEHSELLTTDDLDEEKPRVEAVQRQVVTSTDPDDVGENGEDAAAPVPGQVSARGATHLGAAPVPGQVSARGVTHLGAAPVTTQVSAQGATHLGAAPVPGKVYARGATHLGAAPVPGQESDQGATHLGAAPVPGKVYARGATHLGAAPVPGQVSAQGHTHLGAAPVPGQVSAQGHTHHAYYARGATHHGAAPVPGQVSARGATHHGAAPVTGQVSAQGHTHHGAAPVTTQVSAPSATHLGAAPVPGKGSAQGHTHHGAPSGHHEISHGNNDDKGSHEVPRQKSDHQGEGNGSGQGNEGFDSVSSHSDDRVEEIGPVVGHSDEQYEWVPISEEDIQAEDVGSDHDDSQHGVEQLSKERLRKSEAGPTADTPGAQTRSRSRSNQTSTETPTNASHQKNPNT